MSDGDDAAHEGTGAGSELAVMDGGSGAGAESGSTDDGPYDTGPGIEKDALRDALQDVANTPVADINGILQWLSVRRSGTRNTKISKIMAIFDGCPNVVRLARACYFRPSGHRDGNLLDDITADGSPVANFTEDNILTEDFGFDETSGRFSRAGYTPSSEAADAENGDDDESTMEVSAKMWKQMQARLSTLESSGGAVSREDVAKVAAEAAERARKELLEDISSGKVVIDTWSTKQDRKSASQYELGPDFAVFNYKRSAKREDTENLYDHSNSKDSMRKLVYLSDMRPDDVKRIQRRTRLPKDWSEPSTINPANAHMFTPNQVAEDQKLREEQETLLPSFQCSTKALGLRRGS